ncbi:MAG: ribokinase [Rhodospirillales bacterium]|nr:ribokinase [Rhodospirillales bacterium]MCB9995238.1 ribokinase [Rhodospirillales bacterium]
MLIVFGSINMDMVFPADHLPQPGETVLCGDYEITSGGKGANQALAASRLGTKVALVGCVGDDGPALRMLRSLRRDGVMTTGVAESPDLATGCAVIVTDKAGHNQIVVASGANSQAKADQVPDEILKPDNAVLMQMEMPPEENWELIRRAHDHGTTTILNLAPAIHIPQSALEKLDYLIVNGLEARQMAEMFGLTVEKDAMKLARALSQQGKLTCIITLSEQGSVACTKDGALITVPAVIQENVVDTTGAGDAYCGTFAAAIHDKRGIIEAMKMASVAGSLACRAKGAQDSYAYLGDIQDNLHLVGEVTQTKA